MMPKPEPRTSCLKPTKIKCVDRVNVSFLFFEFRLVQEAKKLFGNAEQLVIGHSSKSRYKTTVFEEILTFKEDL